MSSRNSEANASESLEFFEKYSDYTLQNFQNILKECVLLMVVVNKSLTNKCIHFIPPSSN